jgi:hypothetical protein
MVPEINVVMIREVILNLQQIVSKAVHLIVVIHGALLHMEVMALYHPCLTGLKMW